MRRFISSTIASMAMQARCSHNVGIPLLQGGSKVTSTSVSSASAVVIAIIALRFTGHLGQCGVSGSDAVRRNASTILAQLVQSPGENHPQPLSQARSSVHLQTRHFTGHLQSQPVRGPRFGNRPARLPSMPQISIVEILYMDIYGIPSDALSCDPISRSRISRRLSPARALEQRLARSLGASSLHCRRLHRFGQLAGSGRLAFGRKQPHGFEFLLRY